LKKVEHVFAKRKAAGVSASRGVGGSLFNHAPQAGIRPAVKDYASITGIEKTRLLWFFSQIIPSRQQPDIEATIGSFQFSICETSPPALPRRVTFTLSVYFIRVAVEQKLLSVGKKGWSWEREQKWVY
jgi:hypothetical protein